MRSSRRVRGCSSSLALRSANEQRTIQCECVGNAKSAGRPGRALPTRFSSNGRCSEVLGQWLRDKGRARWRIISANGTRAAPGNMSQTPRKRASPPVRSLLRGVYTRHIAREMMTYVRLKWKLHAFKAYICPTRTYNKGNQVCDICTASTTKITLSLSNSPSRKSAQNTISNKHSTNAKTTVSLTMAHLLHRSPQAPRQREQLRGPKEV